MSPVARIFILFSSLIAACWLWPNTALAQASQLNRCAGPGGGIIYTDRRCDTIGARERLPRGAIAGAPGLRLGGCARNLRDLVYEITAAIDNHDVNRLGAVYHWIGQNAQSGDRTLDHLQTIADRPLVDITALRASIAAPSATPPAPSSPPDTSTTPATPTPAAAATGPIVAPQPAARQPVVGLRLQQTLGKHGIPMQTVLGLRRHLDCWWITL